MRNPEKRRATIIAKYGSMENYNRMWFEKRTATLKAKLGEEGYIEKQKQVGALGGAKSKRPKSKGVKRRKRRPIETEA